MQKIHLCAILWIWTFYQEYLIKTKIGWDDICVLLCLVIQSGGRGPLGGRLRVLQGHNQWQRR